MGFMPPKAASAPSPPTAAGGSGRDESMPRRDIGGCAWRKVAAVKPRRPCSSSKLSLTPRMGFAISAPPPLPPPLPPLLYILAAIERVGVAASAMAPREPPTLTDSARDEALIKPASLAALAAA